ncbi:MAG: ribonuclease J [Alphaproteobacteria bacterium]|nr:ribonuclease J [Alphaproteobacteria bacterium]
MTKKTKKIEGLNFVSIGGCSEVGMNLYAYIYNDQWILVDMGMGFDGNLGKELIVPSPAELVKNKSKIKALFITHSHEDHIGAIPYLWPMLECPIYARPFAIEMIKDKLSQFDLDKKVPLIKVSTKKKIELGDFSVEYISVAHSTPESSALAITTPAGVVIHSGDWRIDEDPVFGPKTDEETFKQYGDNGVLALACDSTNSFRTETYGTEKEVRNNLIKLVKEHKKNRILITCFASNLARLESCYWAAKESGRQLVVVGRSLKKIERIAKNSGYFTEIPAFLDEKKASSLPASKALIVCTGSQGEVRSALSKIASGTHKEIELQKDDVMIFSSKVIPGNEKAVSSIQNMLIDKGVKIITDFDYEIHASGHPSKKELIHLYELTRPKMLIPIHGEKLHLYKQAEIAKEYGIKNVVVPNEGDIIGISDKKSGIVGSVETGILAVDGYRLIPSDGVVYKQRTLLSENGVVSVCVKLSKEYAKLVDISSFGVFEDSENVEMTDLRNDIASEIKLSINVNSDKERIKLLIEKLIKTMCVDARGKKPIVLVHII